MKEDDELEVEHVIDSKIQDGKTLYKVQLKHMADIGSAVWMEEMKSDSFQAALSLFRMAYTKPVNQGKDVEYTVEEVLDNRCGRNGRTEYLIRWKGYGTEHDSWEPESNVKGNVALKRFLASQKQLGDNLDIPAPIPPPKAKLKKATATSSPKTRKSDSENLELRLDEDVAFEVEEISAERVRGGKTEYLVHWRGYPLGELCWEPFETVQGSQALMDYTLLLSKDDKNGSFPELNNSKTRARTSKGSPSLTAMAEYSRKRGRPSKSHRSQVSPPQSEVSSEKKGRGRPKKSRSVGGRETRKSSPTKSRGYNSRAKPLNACEEYYVRVRTSLRYTPADIHKEICSAFGESKAPSLDSILVFSEMCPLPNDNSLDERDESPGEDPSANGPPTKKRKSGHKKRSKDSATDDSSYRSEGPESGVKEPDGSFVVEAILKKRAHCKNVQYLVKWVGSEETTWEPKKNLRDGAEDAIVEFERKRNPAFKTAFQARSIPKRIQRHSGSASSKKPKKRKLDLDYSPHKTFEGDGQRGKERRRASAKMKFYHDHDNTPSEASDDVSDFNGDVEADFEVENIVDKKVDQYGVTHYLVQWKGFGDEENTWEPAEHVDSLDLIEMFEATRSIE